MTTLFRGGRLALSTPANSIQSNTVYQAYRATLSCDVLFTPSSPTHLVGNQRRHVPEDALSQYSCLAWLCTIDQGHVPTEYNIGIFLQLQHQIKVFSLFFVCTTRQVSTSFEGSTTGRSNCKMKTSSTWKTGVEDAIALWKLYDLGG